MRKKNKLMICFCFLFLVVISKSNAFETINYINNISSGLTSPVDVAVSLTGDIYVIDEKESKIIIYSPDGQVKFSFGTRGSDQGMFSRPQSIAIAQTGDIIVADTGNRRIQVFNSLGKFVFECGGSGINPGEFRQPVAVSVDRFGFIYVADNIGQSISIFSPTGVFLKRFAVAGNPEDVSVDLERNIYVLVPSVQEKVIKYDYYGKELKELKCLLGKKNYIARASGLVVDLKGDIYLSESYEHSIKKIDDKQTILASFGSEGDGRGQFYYPKGIASDKSGKIYVADSKNSRIQIFEVVGSVKSALTPVETSPVVVEFQEVVKVEDSISGIEFVDNLGLYAITDKNSYLIIKNDGTKIIGKYGRAAGEFSKPAGLDVTKDGTIFVADTYNNRIQTFYEDGVFNFQFGKKGVKTGQFNYPEAIAVNSNGDIYVADTANNRIQIFNKDGLFLSAFGERSKLGNEQGLFNFPVALDIDSNSDVFVVDNKNNRIQIFDKHGKYKSEFGLQGSQNGNFESPIDISIDSNDYKYVADQGNNRIVIFDAKNKFVMNFGSIGAGTASFSKISALKANKNKIYVANYDSDLVGIYQFYPDGKIKENRVYSIQTVYPPFNDKTSKEQIKKKLYDQAYEKAVKDLADRFNVSPDDIKPYVELENGEILSEGQFRLTVSVKDDVSGKIKNTMKTDIKKQEKKDEKIEFELQ